MQSIVNIFSSLFQKETSGLSKDQRKILQHIFSFYKNTYYSANFGVSPNWTLKDFQEKVPIIQYDDIQDLVVNMMSGGVEQSLLPEKAHFFVVTGGTSVQKSKYIPLTKNFLKNNHIKSYIKAMMHYFLSQRNINLLKGKIIRLGGSIIQNPYNPKEKNLGHISAHIQVQAPWIRKFFKTSTIVEDLTREEKKEKIINECINENITGIAGIPLWCIEVLKGVIERTGSKNIHEVWPNFELCLIGGVNATPYYKIFETLCNGKVNIVEVYASSEGFFGAQTIKSQNGGILTLFTNKQIFYEFIPLENFHNEFETYRSFHKKPLTINQVQAGIHYVLVISTQTSGLLRYIVGDTIMFVDTKKKRIKITGRIQYFIEFFNEYVTLDQVDQSLLEIQQGYNTTLGEFTMGKNKEDNCYKIIIEVEKDLKLTEAQFAVTLDNLLKKNNHNYDHFRKNEKIKQLQVFYVSSGYFVERCKKQKVSGRRQSKVPRISNDPNHISRFL